MPLIYNRKFPDFNRRSGILLLNFQFQEAEAKRARSEYNKMIFRQELEVEELHISQEAAIKEVRQLQVG